MGINFEQQRKKTTNIKTLMETEIKLFGSLFSNNAKQRFYEELSVLLNSGINLKKAIDLISHTQKLKRHKDLVEIISKALVSGKSLSDALKHLKYFSAYEIQAVQIGEHTGTLRIIINDLRVYYDKKNKLRRQIISSLTYPIIVLMTALLVVFFMLGYVVPMFQDIYAQNKVTLPWITKFIIALSRTVQDNFWFLVLAFMAVLVLWKLFSKKIWYQKLIGSIQLNIPLLKSYFKKIYLVQFTQAMSLLTNAKIPVAKAIDLTQQMIQFFPLKESLAAIKTDLIKGEKLDACFKKHAFFDAKMIALLQVAEETNQTEYIFRKLYEQYNMELEFRGTILINIFNFGLTLIVGLIVGMILVAMYLPMFRLSSVL